LRSAEKSPRFEKNPLRILDCKEALCGDIGKDAPTTVDCLCPNCTGHFSEVKKNLELMGIDYQEDRRLVRGLDYYTHTAFEIMAPDIGAQSSIGGGGRYNGLVEICGGPPVPGIGFALGIERIILAMERQGLAFGEAGRTDVFVVTAGQAAAEEAVRLLYKLRSAGISADKDYMNRSLKAQMKYAGKIGARYAVIIGEDEMKQGTALVRNMGLGQQESVPLGQLVKLLAEQGPGN
jgi:histidyl-tRNA synthetase